VPLSGVRVVHAIPGRVRLKIGEVRDNPALAWDVEEQLSRIPGVKRVEANPVTGSVLVLFDEPQATPADSLEHLSSIWPAELGSLDPAALGHEHANGHVNGTNGASAGIGPLDRRIVGMFGSLNARVSDATHGTDLKVLFPLALFALGVRGLFTDKLPFPAWYDFFWFALSTFIMLNGSAIDDAAGATAVAL
jgi:copper chaperone CopZ